jgi:cardiolipin synthase
LISKLNTFMQIALVVIVLSEQAIGTSFPGAIAILVYAVLVTTVASGGHYLWAWGINKDIEQVHGSPPHD